MAGALAIGIVSGAYQTEAIRGGFLAIPRGEIEAGAGRGHGGASDVPPRSRRRACCALRCRHGQCLAAGAEGIRADLGYRPGRS